MKTVTLMIKAVVGLVKKVTTMMQKKTELLN